MPRTRITSFLSPLLREFTTQKDLVFYISKQVVMDRNSTTVVCDQPSYLMQLKENYQTINSNDFLIPMLREFETQNDLVYYKAKQVVLDRISTTVATKCKE
jgi:hypothetical protein